MATTTKKPAARAAKAAVKTTKAVQSKTGAGPALAERSKDTKPAFGKAAPKKVSLAAAKPEKAKAKAAKAATGLDGSVAVKMARGATSVAQVAAGAVVATAKGAASLASSVIGRSKAK